MKIIPTLISKNQKELDKIISHYEKTFNYFQLDVMDGKFVRNKSNWFNFKLPKNYKYEAHLMVNDPEQWIKKNYKEFEILIANFEKVKNPIELIKFVKSKKKKIGFALNPETSITQILPYLKYLDVVLILTVHPGKYGAKYIQEINKIKSLKSKYKGIIEADGHINRKDIRSLKQAGVNAFAIGSYLKDSKDLKKSLKELKICLR